MFGYCGVMLEVDLGSGNVAKRPIDEAFASKWVGGRGFAAKVVYDEVLPGTHPFSAQNVIVIAPGPLSGVYLPGSGRVHFASLSPATGGYGDANMGGHLAAEIKYAGYDGLVIRGKAGSPVILVIEDDVVSLRDGSAYWGKGALEAEEALKNDLGQEFQLAVIGPAGENLVKFACISHDFGRQAGRCGMGAVMGSKNLKAIAVKGSKPIPIYRQREAFAKGKEMYRSCISKPNSPNWTRYGTAGVTEWVNEIGVFPTRNFQTSFFEDYMAIGGQALREKVFVNHKACFGCPIPCGKYSRVTLGGREEFVEGPEYETIALVGGNCCLSSIEEVAYVNRVMDDLGLDTISGGNVVAFAMECFERGIIGLEDVGREIRFGDVDSVVFLSKAIAFRQGIGDVLAEGVKHASQRFGKGSEAFAIHVKGLEWSGYESRSAPANMLAYMTCDIGSHHNRAWAVTHDIAMGRYSLEGKAKKVVDLQHLRPLFDCLGVCRLHWVEVGFEESHYAEIFPLVTGLDLSWEEMLKASERIWNLTRAFFVRHVPGFGRSWDYPPRRFYEEAIPSGPARGARMTKEALDKLLDEYYAVRGWDQNGVPTRQKLEELDLAEIATDLGI